MSNRVVHGVKLTWILGIIAPNAPRNQPGLYAVPCLCQGLGRRGRALGVLGLLVDGANDLGNEVNVGETLMVLGDVRALCFVTILPGMEGYAHYHWRCWGFDIDDKFLILYHSYL